MTNTLYNVKAEQSVLGSILLDTNPAMFSCQRNNITVDTFTDMENSKIYGIMERFARDSKGIDSRTIASEYGDESTLLAFIEATPTAAHVEHYCQLIKKAEKSRNLNTKALEISQGIESGEMAYQEASDSLTEFLLQADNSSEIKIHSIGDFREKKVEEWRNAKDRGYVGIPSCIKGINKYLGGWRRGIMAIMAGYRGEGKSSWQRQECLSLAESGYCIGLFSLEDPGDMAVAGMIGNAADESVFGLDVGSYSADSLEKMDRVWAEKSDLPIHIVSQLMSVSQIITTATLLKRQHNIDILFIDHIQIIQPYTLKGKSRNDTLASYSQQLCGMAKSLDIALVCASQLSRDSEKNNRKPRMSDLRDSGAIEQDARQVVLLYYDRDKDHHILEIAKNNAGVSRKTIDVKRMDGLQRFEEIPEHRYGDAE